MDSIPNEILSNILSYFPRNEKISLRSVCHLWKDSIQYELFNHKNLSDDDIYFAFGLGIIDEIIPRIIEREALYKYAALFGRLDIVKMILENDRYMYIKFISQLMIIYALKGRKYDIIKWLIDHEIYIEQLGLISGFKKSIYDIDLWMHHIKNDIFIFQEYINNSDTLSLKDFDTLIELITTNLYLVISHIKYGKEILYVKGNSFNSYIDAVSKKYGRIDCQWLIDIGHTYLTSINNNWLPNIFTCCTIDNINYLSSILKIHQYMVDIKTLEKSNKSDDFYEYYAENLDYAAKHDVIKFDNIYSGFFDLPYQIMKVISKYRDITVLKPRKIKITNIEEAIFFKFNGFLIRERIIINAKRDIELLKYLISMDINFEFVKWHGSLKSNIPMDSKSYHFEKFLLEHVSNIKHLETEMKKMIRSDNVELFRLFLESGIQCEKMLSCALTAGSFHMVKFLMEHNIAPIENFNTCDIYIKTKLVTIPYKNYHSAFKLVINDEICFGWFRELYPKFYQKCIGQESDECEESDE